ncbi:MAG: rhodanese-like domain-containing protein [Myxococcota bacterium]
MPEWFQYVVFAAVAAFFLWTRFAGKTSSDEAHRLVAEGARLVDVRSTGEFASRHLDGALNIPVDQIDRRAGELGPKEKPVVLYCASGARSARAASVLKARGFTEVYDLGAMGRW